MDKLTPEERSKNMAAIKGKDTKPELMVRSMLHRAGYRFSLHRKDLPGKPDIVLRKYKTVIFVHGCFWHRHKGCKGAATPKTRTEWWQAKFERNVANDKKHKRELTKLDWNVITVWECELKNPEKVLDRLDRLLTTEGAEMIQYPTAQKQDLKAAEKRAEYSDTTSRRKK